MKLSSTIGFAILATSIMARQTCFTSYDLCSRVMEEGFTCDISDDNNCKDYSISLYNQLMDKAAPLWRGSEQERTAAQAKKALAVDVLDTGAPSQSPEEARTTSW
ncbi:hypothetical protein A1Q2_00012 [Trichosporon asahii var. asahii CBS 8904]|uniref:Uncharacterized protein n=1 Tax=Trichosporon asahii var. asahii (strain CBS 8904) TaxID=1220162 RepID=K1WAA2_TRIAC|nr:hypothetical protein A1Q2_00012 [Trichosporon asahii var. asahii CBS 8904]